MVPKISAAAVATLESLLEQVGHDLSDCTSGVCLACGAEVENVEPDATDYLCEVCGEYKVYGAEELMLMLHG